MKRLRPFVTQETLLSMYHTWIEPHFDHCSEVSGNIGVVLSQKLQNLQNRALRIISPSTYDTSSTLLRGSLNLDNLSTRRAKRKAAQMYTIVHNATPAYLTTKFKKLYETTKYDLREVKSKLAVPKVRRNYGKLSTSYSGAVL